MQKLTDNFECPRCKELSEKKKIIDEILFLIHIVPIEKILGLRGSEYLEKVTQLNKLGEQDLNIKLEVEYEIDQFLKNMPLIRIKEIRDCLNFHVRKK